MDRWLIKLPQKPKETIITKETDNKEDAIEIITKKTITIKENDDDDDDVVEVLNVTLPFKKRPFGEDLEDKESEKDNNPHPLKTLKTETILPYPNVSLLASSSSSSSSSIAPKSKEKTKEKTKDKKIVPNATIFSKVRNIPIDGAEYQDECLRFTTLNDGRELLIGEDVIAIPIGVSATNPKGIKESVIGVCAGGDHFVPLPGLDVLVVGPSRSSIFETKGRPTLKLKSLPDGTEISTIALPGVAADKMGYREDGDIRYLDSYLFGDGAASLLIGTRRWLWLYTVRKESTSTFSTTLESMLDLSSESALSKSLSPHGMDKVILYADPTGERFALLSSSGSVFMAPMEGGKAGSAPVREIHLHEPMRRSDKDAWIGDMTLYRPSEGGGCRLVTVGSDGDISVTTLDDGTARVGSKSYGIADEKWHATARGSGCSAQYAYAPAFHVAVSNKYGVALTGSRESVVHLWDLRSKKTSPAGKLLSVSPRLASGTPSKINLMCVAASDSGLFAYSNSNDDDDASLKVIVPVASKD
jgi:hypothetical protein